MIDDLIARIAELEADNADYQRAFAEDGRADEAYRHGYQAGHDHMLGRAEEAEAALEAERARRCATCRKRDSDTCPVWDHSGVENIWAHRTPDAFSCSEWEAR